MKKLLFILAGAALGFATASAQDYSDLIISEYVEGSSNNKAIELFNGTGAPIDLSAYSLKKQTNGAGEFKNEVKLEGTLAAGATYVIVNSSSTAELAALGNLKENTITAFNGNDAIKLYKNGAVIDAVGVDTDPSDWGKDLTLRRKCDITSPNATYTASEWETLATDDWSGLGAHCGTITEDETAPEISYIVTAAATATAVEVHFSEALEQASAETAANYTMNNSITVSAAKLGEDGKTVTLTTTAMTEGTAYELTVNGVKDEAGNATDNLKYSFTFGAIEVDDIAAVLALRDTYANAQQYRIKGEVVIVAHVGTSIYVQDKGCETTKGHSILLYDQPKTYEGKFPAGTVLTNVAGSLTIYQNALLEMQYLADNITENGTADVVVTKATIAEVYKDNLYHAALVQFSDVQISDDNGKTFAAGNYRMMDPSGKYMDLHVYASDNIVGEKVPTEKVSVTGYVGVYNGNSQLILRDKSDISASSNPSTAVENNEAIKFSVYPNPTEGLLNVELAEGGQFSLFIYNTNGLQLMRREGLVDNTRVDLSGLAHGVYIVEIRTAEGVVRTKVVVR